MADLRCFGQLACGSIDVERDNVGTVLIGNQQARGGGIECEVTRRLSLAWKMAYQGEMARALGNRECGDTVVTAV